MQSLQGAEFLAALTGGGGQGLAALIGLNILEGFDLASLEPLSAGRLHLEIEVGAQVSGQLQTLHVEVGDRVEEGQLLAEIDARVQAGRVEAAVVHVEQVAGDECVEVAQDEEGEQRRRAFANYQVDEALMALGDDARFLHCLPARRGEEVDASVIDGPRSAVWKQAENRMHTARAALAWMLR